MTDLHAELESLRTENARLRKLLKLTDADAAPLQASNSIHQSLDQKAKSLPGLRRALNTLSVKG